MATSVITSDWSVSIFQSMKNVVSEILIKPFDILSKIPLGSGNATVLDFILGIAFIGIAVSFFWRSATTDVPNLAGSTMRSDKRAFERSQREAQREARLYEPRVTFSKSSAVKGGGHKTYSRRLRKGEF